MKEAISQLAESTTGDSLGDSLGDSSERLLEKKGGRNGNRREVLLEAAAECMAENGMEAPSMRDIAHAAGMKAGSIYYHFPSRTALIHAIYAESVRRVREAVEAALTKGKKNKQEPWEQLEAASAAHLQVILEGGAFSRIIQHRVPAGPPELRDPLVVMRDEYEKIFIALVASLPLTCGGEKRILRLMLLSAMNAVPSWYRPGIETPAEIAQGFVFLLKKGRKN